MSVWSTFDCWVEEPSDPVSWNDSNGDWGRLPTSPAWVLQNHGHETEAEIGIVTEDVTQREMDGVVHELSQLGNVSAVCNIMPAAS